MISLRPYQNDAVAGVRDAYTRVRNPLLVLPTGGGKTVIFSYLAQRISSAGKRVMILAHRDELLEQIHASLRNFRVLAQIVSGGMSYDRRYRVHVASVFTIARRLAAIELPDYLIIDEAHHVTPDTVWGKVIAGLSEAYAAANPGQVMRVLGVTATPCRLSGEGLGESFGEMVLGPTPAQLIEAGWLSQYRMFQPPPDERIDMSFAKSRAGDYRDADVNDAIERNKAKVMGSPVRHYQMHCPGEPGLVFCRSVQTAHDMAERFRAAGFTSAAIDGKMDRAERKKIVRDFGAGDLNVMTSCSLVSEGFDIPAIRAGFDMNPTLSLKEYLQRCGRTLRLTPGDDRPVLLMDHAGNSMQPGFGFPDDDREWSLEGMKRRKKSDVADVAVKQCPKCYACCRPAAALCPECGWKFVVITRALDERDGELVEVDRAAARKIERKVDVDRAAAKTLEDLQRVERERGYGKGWAKHVFEAREKKRAAASGEGAAA